MKTNNVGGVSKTVKHHTSGGWSSWGGNKPPPSKVALLPKDGNKSFIYRLKKWLTE